MFPWSQAIEDWIRSSGDHYMTLSLYAVAIILVIAAVFFGPVGKAGLLAWVIAP